jgi:hypothetical protein
MQRGPVVFTEKRGDIHGCLVFAGGKLIQSRAQRQVQFLPVAAPRWSTGRPSNQPDDAAGLAGRIVAMVRIGVWWTRGELAIVQ